MNDDFDLDKGISIESEKNQTEKKAWSFKKKIIVISALVLIVILIISVILFFIFFKNSKPGKIAKQEIKTENITKKNKQPFENIWALDDIAVTLSGMEGGKTLKISISLELTDPTTKDELNKRAEQIKKYIENLLVSKTVIEVRNTEGKIILRNEIIRKLNNTLESGRVRSIYFTSFIII